MENSKIRSTTNLDSIKIMLKRSVINTWSEIGHCVELSGHNDQFNLEWKGRIEDINDFLRETSRNWMTKTEKKDCHRTFFLIPQIISRMDELERGFVGRISASTIRFDQEVWSARCDFGQELSDTSVSGTEMIDFYLDLDSFEFAENEKLRSFAKRWLWNRMSYRMKNGWGQII